MRERETSNKPPIEKKDKKLMSRHMLRPLAFYALLSLGSDDLTRPFIAEGERPAYEATSSLLIQNKAPEYGDLLRLLDRGGIAEVISVTEKNAGVREAMLTLVPDEHLSEEHQYWRTIQRALETQSLSNDTPRNFQYAPWVLRSAKDLSARFDNRNPTAISEVMLSVLYDLGGRHIPIGKLTASEVSLSLERLRSARQATESIDLYARPWYAVFGRENGRVGETHSVMIDRFSADVESKLQSKGHTFNTIANLPYRERSISDLAANVIKANILRQLSNTDAQSRVMMLAGHGAPSVFSPHEKIIIGANEIARALDQRYSNRSVQEALKNDSDILIIFACGSGDLLARIHRHISEKGYPVNLVLVAETDIGNQLGMACYPDSGHGAEAYRWIASSPLLKDLVRGSGNLNLPANPSIYVITRDPKGQTPGFAVKISALKQDESKG